MKNEKWEYNEYRKAYQKKWHAENKEKRKQHDAEYRRREGVGVYAWKNKLTNEIVYIGSGQLAHRKLVHISNNKSATNEYLQELFQAHGLENYVFEILEKCEENLVRNKEQKYIEELTPICNIRQANKT